MGRVFTINVYFEEKPSRALVCMYEKGYNTLFKVHVFNEELYSILPSGDLEFSFTEGLRMPQQLTHKKALLLVQTITEQISRFLHIEEQKNE